MLYVTHSVNVEHTLLNCAGELCGSGIALALFLLLLIVRYSLIPSLWDVLQWYIIPSTCDAMSYMYMMTIRMWNQCKYITSYICNAVMYNIVYMCRHVIKSVFFRLKWVMAWNKSSNLLNQDQPIIETTAAAPLRVPLHCDFGKYLKLYRCTFVTLVRHRCHVKLEFSISPRPVAGTSVMHRCWSVHRMPKQSHLCPFIIYCLLLKNEMMF